MERSKFPEWLLLAGVAIMAFGVLRLGIRGLARRTPVLVSSARLRVFALLVGALVVSGQVWNLSQALLHFPVTLGLVLPAGSFLAVLLTLSGWVAWRLWRGRPKHMVLGLAQGEVLKSLEAFCAARALDLRLEWGTKDRWLVARQVLVWHGQVGGITGVQEVRPRGRAAVASPLRAIEVAEWLATPDKPVRMATFYGFLAMGAAGFVLIGWMALFLLGIRRPFL